MLDWGCQSRCRYSIPVVKIKFYLSIYLGCPLNGSLNGVTLNVSIYLGCPLNWSLNGVTLNGVTLNVSIYLGCPLNGSLNGVTLNVFIYLGCPLNGSLNGVTLNGFRGKLVKLGMRLVKVQTWQASHVYLRKLKNNMFWWLYLQTQHCSGFFEEARTYWAPSSVAEELYEQLATKKYREIPRNQIQ